MSHIESALNSSQSKPDVFSYLDFRLYLKHYLEFRKNMNPRFSYEIFARKSGVCRTLIQGIVLGTRSLVNSRASQVAKACDLNEWETQYFVTLSLWNQCKDERTKKLYWERLVQLAPRENFYYLKTREQELMLQWHVLALLELMRTKTFREDPLWIARKFRGRVSAEEVTRTIDQLIQFGLVTREDGKLKATDNIVLADADQVSRDALISFHEKNIPLGAKAIREVPREMREVSSMSVGVPLENVAEIKERIRQFRREMLEYTDSLGHPDEVFQMNIQFFPVTDSEVQ